jgi:hypothetical protein
MSTVSDAIKKVAISDVEDAIAASLQNLIGVRVKCSVKSIDASDFIFTRLSLNLSMPLFPESDGHEKSGDSLACAG